MSTAPSFIAKLESGRALPSITTLVRVARATDTLLRLELVRRSGLMEPKGCDRAEVGASEVGAS
jgi:transcriptional regulator with XRE-family HTH domain